MKNWRWLVALLLVLALVGAGCGGDEPAASSEEDSSDEPADEEEAEGADEPEGQVLLEEDFEDDEDPNLWGPVSDDGLTAVLADGALTFGFEQDPWEYFGVPEESGIPILAQWPSALDGAAPELVDTHLTTTVEWDFGGVVGLMCRNVDPVGQEDLSSYQAVLSSIGTLSIYRTSADGIEAPERLLRVPEEDEDAEEEDEDAPVTLPEETAFEFEEGRAYEVGFSCIDTDEGVELAVTLDGEELGSVVDTEDPLGPGSVGVLYSGSPTALQTLDEFEPFSISYDDFTAVNLGDEIDEETIEEGVDPAAIDPARNTFGDPTPPEEVVDPSEEDPEFAALADGCFDGDYAQCDQLYQDTPVGSTYETYGATCGGRLVDTEVRGGCAFIAETSAVLGGNPGEIEDYGSDPAFDELATDCANADLLACDQLYRESDVGSGYEAFGATCGGRLDEPVDGGCVPD